MSPIKHFFVYVALATAPAAAAQGIADAPVQSTRAESMGGAIPTIADDRDALFENPAGIGGVHWGKQKAPLVRKLYFPYGSLSANQASTALLKDLRGKGGIDDSTVGKAIVDANAGDRQYARANTGLGLVFGRVIALPYYDAQVAATAKGAGTNLIDYRQVSTSGIAYGVSASDAAETIALGYSGFVSSRSELKGAFLYDDMINKTARTQLMKDNTTSSRAIGHNVGVTWRMGKAASPSLGLVLKNAGGTKYRVTKGTAETQTVKQDLTAAFSISPQFRKTGELNLSLAADRLMDSDVSFVKKYHVGTELLLGGIGSYATLGLRGGLNSAGPSGGISLNIGLIGLDAGVNAIDIGLGNDRATEHRVVGTVYVNVADF